LRRVEIEEVLGGGLPKGCFVVVRWLDASDSKALLREHVECPEVSCKDWGIFLGVSGRKRRMLLLGKDVVELYNEWGATRIPLELVEEVVLVLPREEVLRFVKEVGVLGRRVSLRRVRREEERLSAGRG
jgi:hypothetical protein